MSDAVSLDTIGFDKFVTDYPIKTMSAVKSALSKYGLYFNRKLVEKNLSGRPGLIRRTGDLARSFDSTAIDLENKVELRISTRLPYAKIQETGGKITPKTGKYLAIPVGPSLTTSGISREISPRNEPGLIFMCKKGGKPFLGKVIGKGKVQVFFLLRESVTIPPRLKLSDTFTTMADNGEYVRFVKDELDLIKVN